MTKLTPAFRYNVTTSYGGKSTSMEGRLTSTDGAVTYNLSLTTKDGVVRTTITFEPDSEGLNLIDLVDVDGLGGSVEVSKSTAPSSSTASVTPDIHERHTTLTTRTPEDELVDTLEKEMEEILASPSHQPHREPQPDHSSEYSDTHVGIVEPVVDTEPNTDIKTYRYNVKMNCGNCAAKVDEVLSSANGEIFDFSISLDKQQVTVQSSFPMDHVTSILKLAEKPILGAEEIISVEQTPPEEDDEIKTYVFKVAMDCEGCSSRVERVLKKRDGIHGFEIALERKLVVVKSSSLSLEDVKKTIELTGKAILEHREVQK